MSYEQVKQYFSQNQLSDRVLHFEQSSATVEQAAAAVGCAPCQIAKTLSFRVQGEPVLIVAAGDARIDNPKFKALFHEKARMIPAAEVEKAVGHAPGGVCPFALLPGVKVYLDISLRRFSAVYPAAGDAHSAVRLTAARTGCRANSQERRPTFSPSLSTSPKKAGQGPFCRTGP